MSATYRRPGIDPRPKGWLSDTEPCFTQEQVDRRNAQRDAINAGVPVWQLPGTDQCVYSTWWGGVPVINGVAYSRFRGHMSIDRAVEMGAREY